ncbi:MAG: acyltransferase family protein [Planctomycetota bacterium]
MTAPGDRPLPPPPAAPLTYRPELDGLRAVAVVVVLLYHARLGCSGGFVGVDVFFVLSGFLIASLICKSVEGGNYTLRNFWQRRVRRIAPPMLVMLVAVLGVGLVILLPEDLNELAEQARAHLLLILNVHLCRHAGYFTPAAETQPLLHMWSLAVEEQFYLLFPLVFPLLWRRSRRLARALLAGAFLLSLGLSVAFTATYPVESFYLPPTRAWELLTGVLLAVGAVPPARSVLVRELLSWSGLIAILCAVLMLDGRTAFPGGVALLPCLGTAAIIHGNTTARSSVGHALAWRPVVGIGLISYALYLWHWPLLVFDAYVQVTPPGVVERIVVLLISVLVAWLSWRFVETPIRKGRVLRGGVPLAMAAVATTWVLLVTAGVVVWRGGLPQRFSDDDRALLQEDQRRFGATVTDDDIASDRLQHFGSREAGPTAILLLGDSHAMTIAPVLDQLAREHGVRGAAGLVSGNPPVLGAWRESLGPGIAHTEQMLVEYAARVRPRDVVLIARWALYCEGQYFDDMKRPLLVDGSGGPTVETARAAFERSLRRMVEQLGVCCERVWLVRQVPAQTFDPRRKLIAARHLGLDTALIGVGVDEHQRRQRFVNQVLSSLEGGQVRVLDPGRWLFDATGHATLMHQGSLVYYDDDHLSEAGAMLLAPMFTPLFDADR